MTDVEVDQSGKVEELRADTVLAFSNDISYSIRIPARVKREAFHRIRHRTTSDTLAYLRLFAADVFLLFKDHLPDIGYITIDIEYTGRAGEIKGLLLMLIRQVDPGFSKERVEFRTIGKKSGAHKLAWAVRRGEKTAAKKVTKDEFLSVLQQKTQKIR